MERRVWREIISLLDIFLVSHVLIVAINFLTFLLFWHIRTASVEKNMNLLFPVIGLIMKLKSAFGNQDPCVYTSQQIARFLPTLCLVFTLALLILSSPFFASLLLSSLFGSAEEVQYQVAESMPQAAMIRAQEKDDSIKNIIVD